MNADEQQRESRENLTLAEDNLVVSRLLMVLASEM